MIITICGSHDEMDAINELQDKLISKGNIVFVPEEANPELEHEKIALRILQFKKIELSDKIIIYDKNNIDDNTSVELNYAIALGKCIDFYY